MSLKAIISFLHIVLCLQANMLTLFLLIFFHWGAYPYVNFKEESNEWQLNTCLWVGLERELHLNGSRNFTSCTLLHMYNSMGEKCVLLSVQSHFPFKKWLFSTWMRKQHIWLYLHLWLYILFWNQLKSFSFCVASIWKLLIKMNTCKKLTYCGTIITTAISLYLQ